MQATGASLVSIVQHNGVVSYMHSSLMVSASH
jgi:hypothetical protein